MVLTNKHTLPCKNFYKQVSNMSKNEENSATTYIPSTSRASTLKPRSEDLSEPTFKSLSFYGKLKFLKNFLTVEPFLLCYVLPIAISSTTVQKINLDKACQVNLNFSAEICHKILAGVEDNTTTDASIGSQILVADMTAWKQPLQSGLPALLILFVGSWSDRTGNRKALMMIPLIGECVSSVGMMLTTYYFLEWPLFVTALIEALPSALTGGWSICIMAVYSYIADVTTIEDRTFRIGLVAIIVTLGVPIGRSISGLLTESAGYYGIFSINLVLYSIGLVYVYFRIHNIKERDIFTGSAFTEFFNWKHFVNTVKILFRKRPGTATLRVWLVLLVHLVITGPIYGETGILFLYTLKKYHFDVVEFSLFSTYVVLMGIIGTSIAITVFSKWLNMEDTLLGIIATACKMASSLVYALAPTRGWFYSGPLVNLLGDSGVTVVRSLGTKVVEPDEVGKISSIVALVEGLAPVAFSPLYSKVYTATVETLPGAFYLLSSFLTVPAFAIFALLYVLHRRSARDVVLEPASKEQCARDNEITQQ